MRQSSVPTSWSSLVKLLHWTMAVALLAMVGMGLLMTSVTERAAATGDYTLRVLGLSIFEAYQLHKSIGVVLFSAVLLRLLVRFATRAPSLPEHMSRAEKIAAKLAQLGLYLLMIGLPVTGWLLAASSPLGVPTVVFGLFELPHPVAPDAARESILSWLHWAGAMLLLALVAVHSLAALKHHFIDRDGVLRTMLPVRHKGEEAAHVS